MPDIIEDETVEVSLNDGESLTDTDVDRPSVGTLGADEVYIYVNDGAEGVPDDYELHQDVADGPLRKNPTWDRHDTLKATETDNATSWTDAPVPYAMRVNVVNRSGGQTTFRIRVVSIQQGE